MATALRRATKFVAPRREAWYGIGEFATTEKDIAAYRELRNRDSSLHTLSKKYPASAASAIDWSKWEDLIEHKELIKTLKSYHQQQMSILDKVGSSDHVGAVGSQTQGWELYEGAVDECRDAVRASEEIVRNGARALYISFHNPPISHLTQSEWLDTDQYWQAFVEKHMYYSNYLNTLTEDPESKEYDQNVEADAMKKWNTWDSRNVVKYNNKLLYQRPSYEYYDLYKAPLIEHMMFYLAKTGGDARMFPELIPHQWMCEIYANRFEVTDILQRRRRAMQEASLSRELPLEFTPLDMDHDGESYYEQWVQRENEITQLTVGRLMGNYCFLSEAVPVQTEAALLRLAETDGKFYSIGDDVNAVFFKPAKAADEIDPVAAFNTWADHLRMTGRKLNPGYSQILTVFHRTLASRKEGLAGRWFTVPGESQADAFMRRLKIDDPTYQVFADYVSELKTRWETATEIPQAQVTKIVKQKEIKYKLECDEYEQFLLETKGPAVTTTSKH